MHTSSPYGLFSTIPCTNSLHVVVQRSFSLREEYYEHLKKNLTFTVGNGALCRGVCPSQVSTIIRATVGPDLTLLALLLLCLVRSLFELPQFSLLLGSSLMVATAEQLALANDPSFRVLQRKKYRNQCRNQTKSILKNTSILNRRMTMRYWFRGFWVAHKWKELISKTPVQSVKGSSNLRRWGYYVNERTSVQQKNG